MVVDRMLNALLISDYPERALFSQILKLRKDLEDLGWKVDLISFSSHRLLFNQENVLRRLDFEHIREQLNSIFKKKDYSVCVISLTQKYLDLLVQNKGEIIDSILNSSPRTYVYVFGSFKVLSRMKIETHKIFLFKRPGVSKVTSEFTRAIIEHAEELCKR